LLEKSLLGSSLLAAFCSLFFVVVVHIELGLSQWVLCCLLIQVAFRIVFCKYHRGALDVVH
jgi:hypothetical protein